MTTAAPARRLTSAQPSRHASPPPATTARPRPRLELVRPAPATVGRLPFAILLGAILVGGLVGLLLLHTLSAQDGFQADALKQKVAGLVEEEQHLELVNQRLAAPQAVLAKATALGMRPSTVQSFHRVGPGRAVGLQVPVTPPPATGNPATTAASTQSGHGAKSATTTKPSGDAAAKQPKQHDSTATAPATKHSATSHQPGH